MGSKDYLFCFNKKETIWSTSLKKTNKQRSFFSRAFTLFKLFKVWASCSLICFLIYLFIWYTYIQKNIYPIQKYIQKLQSTDENILGKDNSKIPKVLLFGDHSFNHIKITSILTASIEFIYFNQTFYYSIISKLTLIYLSICS